jgi:hypothetical protein
MRVGFVPIHGERALHPPSRRPHASAAWSEGTKWEGRLALLNHRAPGSCINRNCTSSSGMTTPNFQP